MDPEDIAAKCQFVPISSIQRAINFLQTPKERTANSCTRNLMELQKQVLFLSRKRSISLFKDKFNEARNQAIYSHNWNKLHYLLKKSPIYEQREGCGRCHYIRALVILMMFHPNAQSPKLLQEYFHMVCSCRTNEEKRALMKLILGLPEKIVEAPRVYPFQRHPNWELNDVL